MFRLWVREFKETHMIKDIVIEDGSVDTRTHKIMKSLEKACREFDLPVRRPAGNLTCPYPSGSKTISIPSKRHQKRGSAAIPS